MIRRAPTIRRAFSAHTSGQLAQEVRHRAEAIHREVLAPLNDRLMGPLERREFAQTVPLPFVLLLGNHSSGKSSFINHVLGRTVQQTGVAPTDDCFTVIAPGTADADRDGPSFVGDPDFGFSPLRVFGPGLLNHVQLKVRSGLAVDGLMLVDSPGMIDSPQTATRAADAQRGEEGLLASPLSLLRAPPTDRGYDFLGVVRWLAERADVVLLFFDPDKPGTTGETLACLTTSLSGVNHKLHIILNKVDRFEQLHDFARAYGSLCWNLAKVIPRKDLPRIYTMFLPGPAATAAAGSEGASAGAAACALAAGGSGVPSALAQPLASLDGVRDEVIAEVHRAPERRVDNTITRLYESARLLHMHSTVTEEARRRFARERMAQWSLCVGLLAGGQAGALAGALHGLGFSSMAALAALSVAAAGVSAVHARRTLRQTERALSSQHGLDTCFAHTHQRAVADGDQFATALWQRAAPSVRAAVTTIGLGNLPRVSSAELARVKKVWDTDVLALRRLSAPGVAGLSMRDTAGSAGALDVQRGRSASAGTTTGGPR